MELREEKHLEKIQTLHSFYRNPSTSKFQQKVHIGEALFRFQGKFNESVQLFFDVAIAKIEKKLNKIMLALIKKAELKQNDVGKYKVEHTIQSDEVYSLMVPDCKQYPEIMKLLSSTARSNVASQH